MLVLMIRMLFIRLFLKMIWTCAPLLYKFYTFLLIHKTVIVSRRKSTHAIIGIESKETGCRHIALIFEVLPPTLWCGILFSLYYILLPKVFFDEKEVQETETKFCSGKTYAYPIFLPQKKKKISVGRFWFAELLHFHSFIRSGKISMNCFKQLNLFHSLEKEEEYETREFESIFFLWWNNMIFFLVNKTKKKVTKALTFSFFCSTI